MLNNQEKKPPSKWKLKLQFDSLVLLVTKVYVGAMVVVIGLALAGYFMVGGLVADASRQQGAEAHKLLLQQLQQRLDDYIRPVEIAAADPQLYELISSPDAVTQRQQELANVIGAQSIMLIPAGQEKDLLGEFPRLSYAELDLIHAAQNGQIPGVEFHDLNHDGQSHIDVVRPVVRKDSVVGKIIVGYILARYDSAVFLERLQDLFYSEDRVELSQALSDGSTQVFMGWGGVELKGQTQSYSGAIKNSSWQLSYWQAPRDWRVQGMSWRAFYWILSAGVLVVLAVALAVLWRLLDHKTRASANKIYEYIWDRLNGHWMGKSYVPELSEVQPTLTRLQNLNWSVAAKGTADTHLKHDAAPSEIAGGDGGAQVEAHTYVDLLYHDSAAVEVEEIVVPSLEKRASNPDVPAAIFRAYDIRGVVGKTLTPDIVYDIGRAFGSEAKEKGAQTIVVGRDGRGSSLALSSALIQGLCDAGRDVIDIGQAPTPVLYFATHYLSARSGIMVTGSHNPAEYNGLKLVLQGETLAEEAVQKLYHRIVSGDYIPSASRGTVSQQALTADYMARVAGDVNLVRELKVVVDCGNGVAGDVAPQLLRVLGCDVVELYCEVDGRFPNHHPDPSQPENLQDLIAAVKQHQADIGIALDGDGDRLGVVDSRGHILWPDRQMMLFAMDILKEHPGGMIIYDVKSSRDLRRVIEEYGGQPLMWKTGHSLLKAKLKETGALMAGELSGHLFLNDRWYGFDDALYAMARLLEIVARDKRPSAEIFKQLPEAISTPEIRVALAEGVPFNLVERLKAQAKFPGAQLITLDGIRAEFDDGWGLVRASNTTPNLTFRFEATSVEALKQVQKIFRDAVLAIEPRLKLPF
jgi:phosphomannomutase/phosphoglucomutase